MIEVRSRAMAIFERLRLAKTESEVDSLLSPTVRKVTSEGLSGEGARLKTYRCQDGVFRVLLDGPTEDAKPLHVEMDEFDW